MLIVNNISRKDVEGKKPIMTIMGTSAECMFVLKKKGLVEVSCIIDELEGELIYEVYDFSCVPSNTKSLVKSVLDTQLTSKVSHGVKLIPTEKEEKSVVEDLPPKWVAPTPEMIIKGKLCRCKAGSNSGQVGRVVYVKRQGKPDQETEFISNKSGAQVSLRPDTQAQPVTANAQGIINEMEIRPLFGVPDKVRVEFLDPKTVTGKFSQGSVSAPLVTITLTKKEFCLNWLINNN